VERGKGCGCHKSVAGMCGFGLMLPLLAGRAEEVGEDAVAYFSRIRNGDSERFEKRSRNLRADGEK
jgi:hypothetical protein